MRVLLAPTEEFIKRQKTSLTADVAVGSNVSIPVISNVGMVNSGYIVLGYFGAENAEICQINQAVSGATSVQVATVKYPHKSTDPVTVIRYNQRKFYGATVSGGSYTELTGDGSPANMQIENPDGTFFEYSGSTYIYFKSTYYNSATSEETNIAEADEVLANDSSRYCSIYQIRKQAGLTNNPRVNDSRVEEKRKQAENEINSAIFSRYTLPLAEVPALITRIATLLGGGYLDYEEYGSDGQGVKWLGEARAILKALGNGTQRLIGVNGTELAFTSSSNQLQGFPNTSYDATDPDGSGVQSFTRGMKF